MANFIISDASGDDDARAPVSDRRFGSIVGGTITSLCAVNAAAKGFTEAMALGCGFGLVIVLAALLRPQRLAPLKRAWLRLGELLELVMSPVIMLAFFMFAMVPVGLLMKIAGKNASSTRL